jgi:hypothetical protein
MIRVFNRFELQIWMIRLIRANTNKFLYFGIQSIVRQILYAVAWVLEGLGIAAHQEVTRYHVHRAIGQDLDDFMADVKIEVGKKGNYARGKLRIQAKSTAPASFFLDAGALAVKTTLHQKTVTYSVAMQDQVFFSSSGTVPGVSSVPYAIVDYIADAIGPDSNVTGEENIITIELVTPHQWIESASISGNGMTGGMETDYTDAEKQEQYQALFSGLATANDDAMKFKARTVPGVRFADVGHSVPTPGETTVFIADDNGLSNATVLEAVQTECEKIRAAGIIANYRSARRYLMYFSASYSPKTADIESAIESHIDSQGFRPEINVYNVVKTLDASYRISDMIFHLISPVEYIRGVYIIGGSNNWDSGELRWNASQGTLSFGDGNPVYVRGPYSGNPVFTLSGSEPNTTLKVRVDPTEFSGFSKAETISQAHYQNQLDRQFVPGDMVRLATDTNAITLEA